jgi:hypothetical protein
MPKGPTQASRSSCSLDAASVEAIAQRVVELLREERPAELVNVAGIARRFGVSRDWVYAHADELGVVRLGSGSRARLRFDPQKVEDRLAEATRINGSPPRRPTLKRRGRVELLPIRGKPTT